MSMAKQLASISKTMGVSFSFKGRPLGYDEVFLDTGLLPGLAKRADQLASLCLGYGIGVSFEDVESALLGSKVSFDQFTPDVIRIFCLADVIHELSKSSPPGEAVSLDELMYD